MAVAVVALVGAACGGDRGGRAEPAGTLERYTSDVDGLTVDYPATWHRAEEPLAAALVGDQVEVLGLATGDVPDAERGCSPYPWAAMRALGDGDLVLTLRAFYDLHEVVDVGRRPLESKPDDLLDLGPMAPGELSGGCAVDGVELWQVDFLAHGRRYRAIVGSRGELDDQRRDELRAVWSSLTLRPIATGDGSAAVGDRFWHVLYSHCGIRDAQFAGREWVADPILDDGNGNPPPGWGNPVQPGVMTLLGRDRARFESRDGELEATFRARTDGELPAPLCE